MDDDDEARPILKNHPEIVMEAIAEIADKLQRGLPLSAKESQYIAEAFGKIVGGLPPDRALGLSRNKGAPSKILSDTSIHIFNRVEELIESGMSCNKACEAVARTAIKNADQVLSTAAVKNIHGQWKKSIGRSKKSTD